jgi:hypothetical protein
LRQDAVAGGIECSIDTPAHRADARLEIGLAA